MLPVYHPPGTIPGPEDNQQNIQSPRLHGDYIVVGEGEIGNRQNEVNYIICPENKIGKGRYEGLRGEEGRWFT